MSDTSNGVARVNGIISIPSTWRSSTEAPVPSRRLLRTWRRKIPAISSSTVKVRPLTSIRQPMTG
ncbi:hypothetical protein Q0F99_09260 [Rathayibacter oskolensis]|uniref:hypothetical protein n=1 Tax=Rathayibacter oskolensis TaxID=1891671 RepID=UPI00265FF60F|nr:hypothetical protein [Rathayibacter oskolensis]WKK73019.1 hypothetical protein Q0F99_09260 [Rathayibacter oskolensis]